MNQIKTIDLTPVNLEQGCAVIMPGTRLEEYSNGKIKALMHRVSYPKEKTGKPRYSIVFSFF